MKLGSLFDGSGTFPLVGAMCGIEPVWASEVEPYPIAVTRTRFPMMKHIGDVTKINGAEIDPVDVLTFGFPCQDISVAGKRKGVKHTDKGDEHTTRSGLFHEAIRIIKEMREATNGVYPTIVIFENVPGLFSSEKGEDFRTVCEEIIKIKEPSAVMPEVPKGGWAYADTYCGDGFSIAYRVLDAQYIRTAQRRRRIFFVADFGGQCASEILFKRNRLRGYPAESGTEREGIAEGVGDGIAADDRAECIVAHGDLTEGASATLGVNCGVSTGRNGVIEYRGDRGLDAVVYAVDQGGGKSGANVHNNLSPTLCTTHGGEPAVAYSFDSLASNSMKSSNPHSGCRRVEVAKTLDTTDQNPSKNQGGIAIVEPVPYTLKIRSGCEGGGKGALVQEDKSATLATNNDQYLFQPVVFDARGNGDGKTASSLVGDHENRITDYTTCVVEDIGKVFALDRACFNQGQNAKYDIEISDDGKTSPLVARGPSAVSYCIGNGQANDAVQYDTEVCKTLNCLVDPMKVITEYSCETETQYIVRRLTPTECARLQGFPDRWGDIDHKADFTDEEYGFWLNVRKTHAEMNGKAVKAWTKKQMLSWYNKLHSDSSELKMWGNGIALPCSLYVMEGVEDVLRRRKNG